MTRRDDILHATLTILADTPLHRLTTRQIAARVGLTQPALFRHFDDRDAIVAAAVAWTRGELETVATAVLAAPAAPLVRIEAFARALAEHATRWPGLPRLLFADLAPGHTSGDGTGDTPGWSAALRGLQAAQRALVASLVRDAIDRGEVPADVDADRAGALFVAGMQGVLAQWLLAGADGSPDVVGFVEVWRAGVVAGAPRGGVVPPPPVSEVHVDATALLRGGVDPLAAVLEAAGRVGAGGVLRVTAPFAPMPLAALLQGRGWAVEVAPSGPGAHTLTARRPS